MAPFSETERAYFAGFWDGEGTFSITKRPDKRSKLGYNYQAYVSVTSTKREIIDILYKKIGKGFRVYRPKNGNANDAYEMQITGVETIIWFIDQLLPYLILKKEIALTLKKYCLSRGTRSEIISRPADKRGYTPFEERLFNSIRSLNHRGR